MEQVRVQAAATTGGVVGDPGDRFRCASLLKPLLFWAATDLPGYTGEAYPRWRQAARAAVRVSDNEPTEALWSEVGGEALLGVLAARAGVAWAVNAERATFGAVLVTAAEVVTAYAALADAADHRQGQDRDAKFLLAMMARVPDAQSLGARAAVVATGHPRGNLAVKGGWDINPDETALRAHAVAILWRPSGQHQVAAALTATPVAGADRDACLTGTDPGAAVLGWADRCGAPLIGAALTTVLTTSRAA